MRCLQCASGFNEILRAHEKLGGIPRVDAEMRAFREVVDKCGFMDLGFVGQKYFMDLGFVGQKYTWKGKQMGGMVLERLDQALASHA